MACCSLPERAAFLTSPSGTARPDCGSCPDACSAQGGAPGGALHGSPAFYREWTEVDTRNRGLALEEKLNGRPGWQRTQSQWEGKVGRAGMGWRAGWWAWGHGATGMDGDCALGSGGHPPMPYPHTPTQRLSPLSGLLTTSLHSVMGRPPFVQVLGFKG